MVIQGGTCHEYSERKARIPPTICLPTSSEVAARSHVVWLTGLSAAGKSTIVDGLNPVLKARGLRTCILDDDSLRAGLCRDPGSRIETAMKTCDGSQRWQHSWPTSA